MEHDLSALSEMVLWLDRNETPYWEANSTEKSVEVYHRIETVICYSICTDEQYKYRSVFDYLAEHYGSPKRDIRLYARRLPKDYRSRFKQRLFAPPLEECITAVEKEYLKYLDRFVHKLLNDNPEDPCFSGITCRNRIELYLYYKNHENGIQKKTTYSEWLHTNYSSEQEAFIERMIQSEIERYGHDRPFCLI